jgi:hypothetical protein
MEDDNDATAETYDEVVETCEQQQQLLARWLRIGSEIRRSTELPGVLAIDVDELVRETAPLAGRR